MIENIQETSKIKVIYVMGAGRSGSTLICDVLGQLNNVFAGGELRDAWRENGHCSCGRSSIDCDTWGQVFLEVADGDRDEIIPIIRSMRRMRKEVRSLLNIPHMVASNKKYLRSKLSEHLRYTEKLFAAIKNSTGCDIIIDSSKTPQDAYLLSLIPNVDLYIIHLVRDPRAVAYSWRRKRKFNPDTQKNFRQLSLFRSSWWWNRSNFLTEILRPQFSSFLRLHYESFMRNPLKVTNEILKFSGLLADTSDIFLENNVVNRNRQSHIFAGNPNRYTKDSEIKLKDDNEWVTSLNPCQAQLVHLFTFPLMLYYGYFSRSELRK